MTLDPVANLINIESYLTGKYPYYDPRGVIYERKMFIRLATGVPHKVLRQ